MKNLNVSTLTVLCRTCNIHYGDIIEEMLRFTKQTVADDHPLSSDPTEVGLLPVEQFTHLEIPVADFQETDLFQIHQAGSTGTMPFRSGGPRNDWVCIQAGGKDSYGDLRAGDGATLSPFQNKKLLQRGRWYPAPSTTSRTRSDQFW